MTIHREYTHALCIVRTRNNMRYIFQTMRRRPTRFLIIIYVFRHVHGWHVSRFISAEARVVFAVLIKVSSLDVFSVDVKNAKSDELVHTHTHTHGLKPESPTWRKNQKTRVNSPRVSARNLISCWRSGSTRVISCTATATSPGPGTGGPFARHWRRSGIASLRENEKNLSK